eukprot:5700249-Lingulodinium_polyedra.AAC.1
MTHVSVLQRIQPLRDGDLPGPQEGVGPESTQNLRNAMLCGRHRTPSWVISRPRATLVSTRGITTPPQ